MPSSLLLLCLFLSLSYAATPIKVLKGPTVSKIRHNSAVIYIELDQPSKCNIEYWSENKSNLKKINLGQKRLINERLKSLTPYTTYNYRINCSGISIPQVIGGTFTTEFLFNIPVIKFIIPPKVTRTTYNSATIEWVANLGADGRISYGEKGLTLSQDFAPVDKQIVELSGLEEGRGYNYQVELHFHGTELKSTIGKFSTSSAQPEILSIFKLQPIVVKISAYEATIQFETTSQAKITIYYGSEKPLKQKYETHSFTKTHSIKLKDLKPNTNYFYQVEVTPKKGGTSKSLDFPFTTELVN